MGAGRLTEGVRSGPAAPVLVAMSDELLPVVHRGIVGSSANQTWRSRGVSLDPRRFADLLRSAHHSAVGLNRDGAPIALYELLSLDVQDAHAEFSLVAFGDSSPVDVFLGAALFIEQCFGLVPIRQMYAFVSAGGRLRSETLARFGMRECGVLPSHIFLCGEYRDLQIYCLTRSDLPKLLERALRSIDPSIARRAVDEVVVGAIGVSLDSLDARIDLEEAGLDSLAIAEMIAALEDTSGHCLEPAWLEQIATVGDLRSAIDHVIGS